MNKKITCILLIVVCVLSVTACSSSDRTAASIPGSAGDGGYMAYEMNKISDTAEYNEVNYTIAGGATTAPTVDTRTNTQIEKKIIRNANLSIETADVTNAYQKLLDYVKSVGGYEFNMDMNKREEYISLSATLKVKPDTLDLILDYAAECGDVKYVNTSSDDITAEYYDTELRLENKRKNLDKYYEYLKEARNVEELIMLQNEIDRLTAEIESYEGQLKFWNTKTSESEIYLSIYQKGDPVKLKEVDWSAMSFDEMLMSMGNGFKGACNVVIGFFQWLVIIIITVLPVFAVLGVVAVPITAVIIRKKRKNKDKESTDKDNEA